jgi:hypothetical protein
MAPFHQNRVLGVVRSKGRDALMELRGDPVRRKLTFRDVDPEDPLFQNREPSARVKALLAASEDWHGRGNFGSE